MKKLKNFPIVNYVNLRESTDRRRFMESQLEKYGLKGNAYVAERFETFSNQVQIHSAISINDASPARLGVTISFLEMMKSWYELRDEQYGLFCDDDISFESIDYWNFNWQDVLDNLPENWQCVQLIRLNEWESRGLVLGSNVVMPDLRLRKAGLYDWGTSFMCKRSYVKKVLDRHITGENSYDFSIKSRGIPDQYLPYTAEHVLMAELTDHIYNFPILIENQEFTSTIESESVDRFSHTKSYKFYSGLWKLFGKDLPIEYLMNRL
jgi:hypothetical protein